VTFTVFAYSLILLDLHRNLQLFSDMQQEKCYYERHWQSNVMVRISASPKEVLAMQGKVTFVPSPQQIDIACCP
jgi:hypothetical protein